MGLYDDVYAALHAAGVRFVVVGGTAVVLHGHARMTVDLDLVVDLEVDDNALAAVDALTSLGLLPRLPVDPRDFADAAIRTAWVEQRHLLVFSFFDPVSPAREIDLFATMPVPFAGLHSDAVERTISGVPIRIASREHLIEMKRATGRTQDLADIEFLQSLPRAEP